MPREGSGLFSFPSRKRRIRTPKAHSISDGLTEGLIYFMVVFTPWAFGTTQSWSIGIMNVTGCMLGLLLMVKWIIRRQTGYQPQRWGDGEEQARGVRAGEWMTWSLAALTALVLLYILVSFINGRADYYHPQRRFEYFDAIRWLPHSYDKSSTWQAFWIYSGLACFFWAARDWLLTRTREERHQEGADSLERRAGGSYSGELMRAGSVLPVRLRRLLWILCINGALIGLVGILQRLDGTNKLLWMVEPRINRTAEAQFGPYAYRANAAQYLNLIWPVCLGFCLVLRRSGAERKAAGGRVGSGNHLLLLPCAVIMAACPIISASRGGALVAFAMILVSAFLVVWLGRRESPLMRAGMLSVLGLMLAFGGFLGWKQVEKRFETIFTDQMSMRVQLYQNARPILKDFPWYGSGPGTFATVYQLYREEPGQVWEAYAHDDWLETRITFGWIGFLMILGMLGLSSSRWIFYRGITVRKELIAFILLAFGGGLVHARFDFPFQVYSILLAALLLLVMLFCFSRQRS